MKIWLVMEDCGIGECDTVVAAVDTDHLGEVISLCKNTNLEVDLDFPLELNQIGAVLDAERKLIPPHQR